MTDRQHNSIFSILFIERKHDKMKLETEFSDDDTKNKWIRRVVIIVAILLFMVFLVFVGIVIAEHLQDSKEAVNTIEFEDGTSVNVDDASDDEIRDALNKKMEESMYTASCSASLNLASATGDIDVVLINDKNNKYPEKMKVVMNDDGKVLYESKAVKIGNSINGGKAEFIPAKGTYEIKVQVIPLDPKTGDELSSSEFMGQVVVE